MKRLNKIQKMGGCIHQESTSIHVQDGPVFRNTVTTSPSSAPVQRWSLVDQSAHVHKGLFRRAPYNFKRFLFVGRMSDLAGAPCNFKLYFPAVV